MHKEPKEWLRELVEGRQLTFEEAVDLMNEVMSGQWSEVQIAGLLMALRMRGETPQEIAGFAQAMREHSLQITPQREGLLDTCGTGGDMLKTWNLSTATAFVVAAAGVPIAKHGNRAVSSKCGSADVLEACGINLQMTPERVEQAIEQLGIGFLFAPQHHPAMKFVAPVRRELGVRTVFNLLGPLTNPAGAKRQLLGVYDWRWLVPIAEALRELGSERALIVHGMDGLDEVSPVGATVAAHLKENGTIETFEFTPGDLGLTPLNPGEISAGENIQENAEKLKLALSGQSEILARAILPGAAAAFWVASKVEDIRDGVWLAEQVIQSGHALKLLEKYAEFSRQSF
jgi:anthranilate phosphoribosyltransferase